MIGSNWNKYKGAGPWNFSKSTADDEYNVGNEIVNSSNPIWTMNHSGVPITDTHIPCGYWTNKRSTGVKDYEFKDLDIEEVSVDHIFVTISWTPRYGGAYGRFVAFARVYPNTHPYYSDDGGYTWIPSGFEIPEDFTAPTSYYVNKYIVATKTMGESILYVTEDGINYTTVDMGFLKASINILYDKTINMYYVQQNIYPSNKLRASNDLFDWSGSIVSPTLAYYNTFYLVSFGGYILLLSYNDNIFIKVPADDITLGGSFFNSPVSLMGTDAGHRYEAAVYRNMVIYNKTYMTGDFNWHSHNAVFRRVDTNGYNTLIGGSLDDSTIGSGVYSINGIDWKTESRYAKDVATGSDRVIRINGDIKKVYIQKWP